MRLNAALDEIAIRTGHTAYFGVLEGREMIFLATRPGTGVLQVVVTPGERIWAHATGAGKALLARRSDAELGRVLGARPVAISVGLPTFEATPEVLEALGQSLLKTAEGLATWARGSTS